MAGNLRVLAALLALAACARPHTLTPALSGAAVGDARSEQAVAALRHLRAEDDRLQDIAWRLATTNTAICPDYAGPVYGLKVWNADLFDDDLYAAAISAFNVGSELTVSHVVPGSPAERAGLLVGDRITAVHGVAIPPGKDAVKAYGDAVLDGHRAGSTKLALRVSDAKGTRDIVVPGANGCMFPVSIIADDTVNAMTDGLSIYLTRGMMRFARDERELAIVVAHEMAHNAMGHSDAQAENAIAASALGMVLDIAIAVATGYGGGGFTDLGAQLGAAQYSVEFEQEADYVGTYFLARAGYDITGATDLWRRLGVEFPETLESSYTHPAAPERFVMMDAAIQEIRAKEAAKQPLVPNMQPAS